MPALPRSGERLSRGVAGPFPHPVKRNIPHTIVVKVPNNLFLFVFLLFFLFISIPPCALQRTYQSKSERFLSSLQTCRFSGTHFFLSLLAKSVVSDFIILWLSWDVFCPHKKGTARKRFIYKRSGNSSSIWAGTTSGATSGFCLSPSSGSNLPQIVTHI